MRYIISVVLWILNFAAEAPVRVGNVQRDVLTGRTSPARLVFRAIRPLDDAVQMNDVEAIRAAPR